MFPETLVSVTHTQALLLATQQGPEEKLRISLVLESNPVLRRLSGITDPYFDALRGCLNDTDWASACPSLPSGGLSIKWRGGQWVGVATWKGKGERMIDKYSLEISVLSEKGDPGG